MKLDQYNDYLVSTVDTDCLHGVLASAGHQQLQCWVRTHTFPDVNELKTWKQLR